MYIISLSLTLKGTLCLIAQKDTQKLENMREGLRIHPRKKQFSAKTDKQRIYLIEGRKKQERVF